MKDRIDSAVKTIQNYQLKIQHLDGVSRGSLGTPLGQVTRTPKRTETARDRWSKLPQPEDLSLKY